MRHALGWFGEKWEAMSEENVLIATVKRYFEAIERGDIDGILSHFAPEAVQEEFPNRLLPQGAVRDYSALREGALRGRQVMRSQRYEIVSAIASGNSIAVEAIWTGTLAVPFGTNPAGGQMRARFAVFLEFRDGRIVRQRNYDCFYEF
jgi:ketosteroid isomerase-like protein